MAENFKRELKTAFFETGLLVAGGMAGAALSYWLISQHWLVSGIAAVIGAAIAYHGGRTIAGRAVP